MKKQLLFITAFLALATASFSQGSTYRTTEYVGAIPATDDAAVEMCEDSDGNIIAVGKVNNGSNMDISVSKFDNLGNLLWEQIYDNGGDDIPLSIEVGESNNIYISGNAQVSGTDKGLILKYNTLGSLLWDSHAGGVSGSTILDSKTTSSGETYLVGSYMSSATDQKAILYKFTSDGAQDWLKTYDYGSANDDDDVFTSINVNDNNDNIYCGGMADGSKILIARYNSSGTLQWAKTPRAGKVLDITTTTGSYIVNIYIAAQTNVYYPDAYTAKYDSNGDLQWEDAFTDGALSGSAEIHHYISNVYVAYRHNAGSGSPEVDDFIKKYSESGVEQWIINGWKLNLGTYSTEGKFGVSDDANIISFWGNYLYSIAENMSVWRYTLADGPNDYVTYYPIGNPFYADLIQHPDEVIPVRAFFNNTMLFILGDGKVDAADKSRVALASYCVPVSTVSIEAPYHTCDNPLSVSASSVSSAKWDYRAENGGTFTSFSNINALNTDVTVSYTNDMDIMLMVRGEDENTCPTYTNQIINFHSIPEPVISGDLSFCEGTSTVLDAGAGYDSYDWSNGDDAQSSTITSAGTYSVEVTDANSCTSLPVSVNVTEIDLATVSLGMDKEICEGESVTLDAGTFDSYSWSTGASSQSIDVSSSGQIILEITSAGYCDNSDTVMVTVNDLPTVSLGQDQTSCNGETVTLDAGIYDSYSWSTGASSQTIDVTSTGDYILEVTASNSCSNSDTIHVEFEDCTGINTYSQTGLNIYPNPATNQLNIDNGQLVIENIQILDITGKVVKNIIAKGVKQSINITDLKQGVYFIKIYTSDNTKTSRFIKK